MIPPEEREGNLSFTPYQEGRKEEWVIGRGDKYFATTSDPRGQQPFSLGPEGRLSIYHPNQAMAKLGNSPRRVATG